MNTSIGTDMIHTKLPDIAGATHVGMRRRNNEDAIAWDAQRGLALVADGVGGNSAGEVASGTAARSIQADLACVCPGGAGTRAASREDRRALVQELVRRANRRIRDTAARDARLAGMGTTLAMLLLAENFVTVAHVGDSRVYRLREGRLERLTVDHHLSVEIARGGAARALPPRWAGCGNILTRALGANADSTPDIAHHDLQAGDLYLLCSDGLTVAASDGELAQLLCRRGRDLDQTARDAVTLANSRGGRDNVSVVLVRLS